MFLPLFFSIKLIIVRYSVQHSRDVQFMNKISTGNVFKVQEQQLLVNRIVPMYLFFYCLVLFLFFFIISFYY